MEREEEVGREIRGLEVGRERGGVVERFSFHKGTNSVFRFLFKKIFFRFSKRVCHTASL